MPEQISEEPQELGEGRVWITGSKTRPWITHVTILTVDGEYLCLCEGFKYNGRCRHITDITEILAEAEGDW